MTSPPNGTTAPGGVAAPTAVAAPVSWRWRWRRRPPRRCARGRWPRQTGPRLCREVVAVAPAGSWAAGGRARGRRGRGTLASRTDRRCTRSGRPAGRTTRPARHARIAGPLAGRPPVRGFGRRRRARSGGRAQTRARARRRPRGWRRRGRGRRCAAAACERSARESLRLPLDAPAGGRHVVEQLRLVVVAVEAPPAHRQARQRCGWGVQRRGAQAASTALPGRRAAPRAPAWRRRG